MIAVDKVFLQCSSLQYIFLQFAIRFRACFPFAVISRRMTDLKQKVSESDESGPVVRFGAPALQHDVVNVLRAVVRLAQPLGLHIHLVEDL